MVLMALADTPRTKVTSAVIADYLLQGLSMAEIAQRLGISHLTLRHYIPSVKRIVQAALASRAKELAEATVMALDATRQAMDAVTEDGQPDWSTRLNAVRSFGSLIQAVEKAQDVEEANVSISANVSYSLIEALDAYRNAARTQPADHQLGNVVCPETDQHRLASGG